MRERTEDIDGERVGGEVVEVGKLGFKVGELGSDDRPFSFEGECVRD